jgi:hypothetical protein
MHCSHIYHSIVFMGNATCHAPSFMEWFFFILLCMMCITPVAAIVLAVITNIVRGE